MTSSSSLPHVGIELPEAIIVKAPSSISTTSSSSSSKRRHLEKHPGNVGVGGHVKRYLREYCLGCIPPHIRRKGVTFPPLKVRPKNDGWTGRK